MGNQNDVIIKNRIKHDNKTVVDISKPPSVADEKDDNHRNSNLPKTVSMTKDVIKEQITEEAAFNAGLVEKTTETAAEAKKRSDEEKKTKKTEADIGTDKEKIETSAEDDAGRVEKKTETEAEADAETVKEKIETAAEDDAGRVEETETEAETATEAETEAVKQTASETDLDTVAGKTP